eukprot:TRINITY_DN11342_c0_g3_i1.p1 TRINITY_DN11342_c0_g3~~TRINITY_DN11342_c0_g3_i1.p1  ORF type:complete len:795 (+),score=202.69 TRINITY_DN11342_c0_g3_i1:48-2432(+)
MSNMNIINSSTGKSYFTAISGAHGEGALCYLLEVGKEGDNKGFNILLDCGWNDSLMEEDLMGVVSALREIKLSCILLSGSSMEHMGALPYLVEQLGLTCPVFATHPVKSMGHITLYDCRNYCSERTGKAPFSVESVDKAMSLIHTLKFYEVYRLQAEGSILDPDGTGDAFLSPTAAGCLLGSSIWHIVKDSTEISYAPFFNNKTERHLPPADLRPLLKSTVCITSSRPVLESFVDEDRDNKIIDTVMGTLRRDGNILIPTDATGRVMELMLMMENHWKSVYGDGGTAPYSIVFLCEYGECTVAMAEQALEFASDSVRQIFEARGLNPLSFIARGAVKFCRTRGELEDITGPKVVFATPASVDIGYSLDLMLKWGENPRNAIIIIDKSGEDTVARRLAEYANSQGQGDNSIFIEVHREVDLAPEDLAAWREREQKRLDEEAAAAAVQRQRQNIKEITDDGPIRDSDSESDEENDHKRKDGSKPTRTTDGLFLPSSMAYNSKHLMFPCIDEEAQDGDDYGMSLDPEILKKLKQSEDSAVAKLRDFQRDEEKELQRREWEEAEAARPKTVDELDPPKEYTKQMVHIDVEAAVYYYPHEGICDGATLKHVLKSQCTQAQEIVIVNGSDEQTEELAAYCKASTPAHVRCPAVGDKVELTPSTCMYRTIVDDDLIDTLNFTKVGEYKVASVEGVLARAVNDDLPAPKRRNTKTLDYPVLTVDSTSARGQPATFVGDVTLRELGSQLRKTGWRTEFKKGTLMCDKQCVVNRADKGDISMTGVFTSEWFKLRSALRNNYKVL